MSELQNVRNKIFATEERLANAERINDRDLALAYAGLLEQLQVKENRLLSAPDIHTGKPKLYFNSMFNHFMVKNILNC